MSKLNKVHDKVMTIFAKTPHCKILKRAGLTDWQLATYAYWYMAPAWVLPGSDWVLAIGFAAGNMIVRGVKHVARARS